MLTMTEFMALEQGTSVSFCSKRFVVDGITDTNEPQLKSVATGETLSGAIYGAHLMSVITPERVKEIEDKEAADELKRRKDPVETVIITVVETPEPSVVTVSAVIEFESPAKRPRGRPRKNP